MSFTTRVFQGAALSLAIVSTSIVSTSAAQAASDPRGIWYDHNGRGAVEIADCENGRGLCGYVVHVKNNKHLDRCGTQILGNVTTDGGGWIYSPSRGRKYTVRLSRLSDSKLRVVGNASSSLFSKTFTWNRAPDGLEFCGKYASRNEAPAKAADVETAKVQPEERFEEPARKTERDPLISDYVTNAKPRRYNNSSRDIEADEEAELERNASGLDDERDVARDEDENEKVYGAEPGNNPDEAPVENEVTEVIDKLIDKANEYTGKMERKCKFRIPYVDRVIYIPCRD